MKLGMVHSDSGITLAALIIVSIVVATIAVGIAIWELVNRHSPWGIRRFRIWRLRLAPATGAPANLALARAAYDRGDYLRACEILDKDGPNGQWRHSYCLVTLAPS
jgi:hypothetical protein